MRTTVDQKLQCMFPARKKWYRNHVSCCGEFPWLAKNNTSNCEGALQIKDHPYRKREDLKNSSCFSNLSCFKSTKFTTESRWQSSLWFLLFNPTFPISACTTQALYSDFDVFADWKRFFFLIAKVRVALGMSPDDRFYPPRKHILENSFQVQHKPMTQKYTKATDLTRNPPLTCKCIKLQRDRDLPIH